MSEINKESVFKENFVAILDSCRKDGIQNVLVTYEWQGDDGGVHDVFFGTTENPACAEDAIRKEIKPASAVLMKTAYNKYCKNERSSTSTIEEKNMSLKDACEQIAYDYIERSGHEGFENSSGGRGEMMIDVVAGTINLSHVDYIESESNFSL